jgi:gliding motility-associated-like protein
MITLLLLSQFAGWHLLPAFPFALSHPAPTEICDNALDDDGDELIDLNDPDCECPVLQPLSLIPNPSFEEMECCPSERSQLHCASGWIQASEPTTDYLNTCGWMGWNDLPPPLPFPDGNGCVGFRNGRVGGNNQGPQPNWKEYAGACLSGPLKAGVTYRFEFYIGFTYALNSPPTSIVFFGTTSCTNLPFGVGYPNFGCPTNGPGWKELGSVPISGANEWQLKEITVTPTEDIHAIAIGPSCTTVTPTASYYYFFDNLVLAAATEFAFKISATGHPCSENITLSMPFRDTLQYQWYRDGVALPGETSHELKGVSQEGNYQVRVLGPNSCRITSIYRYSIPQFASEKKALICHGETYPFGQQNPGTSGVYFDTLKTADGCDSIVRLSLDVSGEIEDTVEVKIFEGESWQIGSQSFSQPGEYSVLLKSSLGCDSLVRLFLDFYKIFIPSAFSPNDDGLNDVFGIFPGEGMQEVLSLKVYNRWGGLVYEANGMKPGAFQQGWDGRIKGKTAPQGVYVYHARITFDDGNTRDVQGAVTLLR